MYIDEKHELEDLKAQAQTSSIDYSACGYDTNKDILSIDADTYNDAISVMHQKCI